MKLFKTLYFQEYLMVQGGERNVGTEGLEIIVRNLDYTSAVQISFFFFLLWTILLSKDSLLS